MVYELCEKALPAVIRISEDSKSFNKSTALLVLFREGIKGVAVYYLARKGTADPTVRPLTYCVFCFFRAAKYCQLDERTRFALCANGE